MIRGEVVVDLSVEPDTDWNRDRRQLQVLDLCPNGATVNVLIGARKYPSQDVAHLLKIHGDRLDVVVSGPDPEAVLRFVMAARAGDWSVSA